MDDLIAVALELRSVLAGGVCIVSSLSVFCQEGIGGQRLFFSFAKQLGYCHNNNSFFIGMGITMVCIIIYAKNYFFTFLFEKIRIFLLF